jgi:hypothetical protein
VTEARRRSSNAARMAARSSGRSQMSIVVMARALAASITARSAAGRAAQTAKPGLCWATLGGLMASFG